MIASPTWMLEGGTFAPTTSAARAVVASEQASAIRASNFTPMCFMVVRLSPSIHLLDVRQLPQITPSHFLLGEAQKL